MGNAPVRHPSSSTPVHATSLDPETVELQEGTFRFRHDPLGTAHRALLGERDHINGNPLDWALHMDPHLDEAIIAVRDTERPGEPVWFDSRKRLRTETFTSILAGRPWRPNIRLTRRLLVHVPYVLVLPEEDRVRHAFDLRTVTDPRQLARVLQDAGEAALPATGAYAAREAFIHALVAHVPYAGDRYARSTRKRFHLRVPGGEGDATVEGTAARILSARGHHVETPRLLLALYRLLVTEVVGHWWRDPVRMEQTGSLVHHPPGANPLEATRRGLEAVAAVAAGEGPQEVKRLGETVIQRGARPPTYRRYVNRLARLADAFRPDGLAGVLEGILRGHGAHNADLLATHPSLPRPLLVEVKSTGDRLRATQAEAALYHERDGRAGYRLMRIEHAKS